MAENENKIGEKIKNIGGAITETKESMQQFGGAFVFYAISLVVIMGIFAVIAFIVFNKGYERQIVPDVTGKNILDAQLILQEKELYPRLQMRYSDVPGQSGMIISQSPKPGSVVKASSRITLVVSRGIVFDHVKNYVGSNLDAVKTTIDALYAGTEIPSLKIANPIFKQDEAPAGTILEQEPSEGTPITQPVTLKFIVSSGPEKAKVSVPDFTGKTIAEVLTLLSETKLTVDFTQHIASGSETPGTVVRQSVHGNKKEVAEYSRIILEFAMPEPKAATEAEMIAAADNEKKTEGDAAEDAAKRDTTNYVHGIFSTTIPEYPYAVPVKLDVIPQEGSRYSFASFSHIGGNFSVPFAAPHGSVLVLSVLDREVERSSVQ